MKLALHFRSVIALLSASLASEFDQLITRINTWSAKEHLADGTHGDITATSVTTASYLSVGVTSGITASTTQTQGQVPLTTAVNIVATCANLFDTVTMPAAVTGRQVTVSNQGAQPLQVFPDSGDAFYGSAVNASTTVASAGSMTWIATDATTWYPI